MKKAIKISAIAFAFVLVFVCTCYGAEYDNLRIRIRSPRQYNEQTRLKGYEDISMFNIKTGEKIHTFKNCDELDFLIDSFYDSKYGFLGKEVPTAKIGPYHLKIKDKLTDTLDEAKAEADKHSNSNILFYPYYNGEKYEIWAGVFANTVSATQAQTTIPIATEIISGEGKTVMLYNRKNEVVFAYKNNCNLYFTSHNLTENCNIIKIGGKDYRGMIGFNIADGNKLISINYVDMESYLYGVVPNEVSASWPIEAIKAQVLAARTYAASMVNPTSANGYDLEDNQNSQVYRGYTSENSITNKAVDDTAGEMIYYNDKLIEAYFHSTSGGRTENSENIWSAEIPYLRGVEDEYSNISPQSSWQKVATKSYVVNKLRADGNDISDVYNIVATKISENNRVLECIFYTDKGQITYKKENIRRVLGYDFLLSNWFTIEHESESIYFANKGDILNAAEQPNSNILDDVTTDDTEQSNSNLDWLIEDDEKDKANEKDKTEQKDSTVNNTASGPISDSLSNKYTISSNGVLPLGSENTMYMTAQGKAQRAENTNSSSEFYFNGRGWGHGIGMSQYGAKQMATEGFNYIQILKHYYTGVEIK